MWLHSVACRAARSTCARTRSPTSIVPALGDDREHLVVAEPQHVIDPGAAVAVQALDVARVGDLAAAGRVERGLDELDQHASVVALGRADRGLGVGRLVADEIGGEPGVAGERERRACGARRRPRSGRAGSRSLALLVHQDLEARLVDAEVVLGDELERQVDREPVSVVKQERVGGGDPFGAGQTGTLDQLVEPLEALLERPAEPLLLGLEPLLDRVALLVELAVLAIP